MVLIMALNSRSNSRFAISTPILTRDGRETYGIAKKFRFMDRKNLNEDEIKPFVVTHEYVGRPDKIATKIYNNQDLYFIIIQFNRAENPFQWPPLGLVIEYPSKRAVFAEL
jgi:hypothetical protein